MQPEGAGGAPRARGGGVLALGGRGRRPGRDGDATGDRQRTCLHASTARTHELRDGVGGHRRHHQLHQHLQPVGDDRRRPAGEEGGRARGSAASRWVKTSLAPGSRVVTDYLERRRPAAATSTQLGFQTVGLRLHHLHRQQRPAAGAGRRAPSRSTRLVAAAVLSGNRNFEARVHPLVRANYLASPMLVVAFALVGRVDIDLDHGAARHRRRTASRCSCATSGPPPPEISETMAAALTPELFEHATPRSSTATSEWQALEVPAGSRYAWDDASTYVQEPPFFQRPARRSRTPLADIRGARVLAVLGDSVTTDHISPAGAIPKNGPAAQYLARARRRAAGLEHLRRPARQSRSDDARHLRQRADQERAGARQGRQLDDALPDRRGDVDLRRRHALHRRAARRWWCSSGKEYGTGSSRDWAAKGTALLGVKAVHRRELRADPPQQPGRAWACCRWPTSRARHAPVARPHGAGDLHHHRHRQRAHAGRHGAR